MSYDINLTDPVTHEVIELSEPHFMRGGTYAVGGTTDMWLNVTYNYAKFYYRDDVLGEDGIRTIYGMTGAESIPVLEKAIAATLGTGTCRNDCTNSERTETCHEIEDEDTGFIVCSECGAVHDESYTAYYCWCCGRRIEQ